MNTYYIYIMTNEGRTVLYVGITNDLERRVNEHKSGKYDGFTKKYRVHVLLYYETYGDVNAAIMREKQLKHWRRSKKEALIATLNPMWKDLSEE